MKSNPLYRHRGGSIIVVLIGALAFVAIFFSLYCFKQWQVNRRAAQTRTAPQAQQKPKPALDYHWPSPDGRLAFKPPPFSRGDAEHQNSSTTRRAGFSMTPTSQDASPAANGARTARRAPSSIR